MTERRERKGDFAQAAKSVVDEATRDHEDDPEAEHELDLTSFNRVAAFAEAEAAIAAARLNDEALKSEPTAADDVRGTPSTRREAHPNARRLVESRAGLDTPEAVASREWARAAVARAEAGKANDTSEFIERKFAEEQRRRLGARGMGR